MRNELYGFGECVYFIMFFLYCFALRLESHDLVAISPYDLVWMHVTASSSGSTSYDSPILLSMLASMGIWRIS